jgi:hypothetical protein
MAIGKPIDRSSESRPSESFSPDNHPVWIEFNVLRGTIHGLQLRIDELGVKNTRIEEKSIRKMILTISAEFLLAAFLAGA